MATHFHPRDLAVLRSLADQYPTTGLAAAEIAVLEAGLALPRGAVHVVSDVHGEYKKLRHIINNASGRLRPLVAELFRDRLTEVEQQRLLSLLYYPRETIDSVADEFGDHAQRHRWVALMLRRQFEIVRELSGRMRRRDVEALFPDDLHELFEEMLGEPGCGRPSSYVDTMIGSLARHDRDLEAVRAAARLVRNLSVAEIIVAGDLGDRGPRLDFVIDYLMRQPRVSIAWGNHDISWMGACLGSEALIATVLRISLRYRRLSQIEEGYGIIMSPLEKLVRDVYMDDPAERFRTRGTGLRDDLLMARMQKAIAVLQFKLEGQIIMRHPEWEMDERNLLHRIDRAKGTIRIGGETHELLDTLFPTVDENEPYALSPEEEACMGRLRQSFMRSAALWKHMSFVARHGATWLRRDEALIFHGCVPVDEKGTPLELVVDGATYAGRDLFAALDSVVRRAFRAGVDAVQADVDWLWYLWTGPRSPLFGKDRMATFERYFVADAVAKKEMKNPYFQLIHDADFCRRLAADFGLGDDALIVNGHVPVKVEKGDEPVKRGGNAVTIDGAFSEAYGDRGYTLLLEAERIALAEHHHFESITEAIRNGADIVPKVVTIRQYETPRLVGGTDEGAVITEKIDALNRLIEAYREGAILEGVVSSQ